MHDRVPSFPRKAGKRVVKTTLGHGVYSAELFFDPKTDPPIYHYIVTRKDSAEILAWGQALSKAEAELLAMETMQEMSNGKSTAQGWT